MCLLFYGTCSQLSCERVHCIKVKLLQVSRSNWGLDPFSRGSYSYVATDSSVEDVSTLYEPLSSSHSGSDAPIVCFAGEATCLKHIGTTAGAFMSGVREARRILDFLGHSTPGANSES